MCETTCAKPTFGTSLEGSFGALGASGEQQSKRRILAREWNIKLMLSIKNVHLQIQVWQWNASQALKERLCATTSCRRKVGAETVSHCSPADAGFAV